MKKVLGDDVVICIVGNKMDLEKDRHVTQQDAEELVIIMKKIHDSI